MRGERPGLGTPSCWPRWLAPDLKVLDCSFDLPCFWASRLMHHSVTHRET